MCVQGISAFMQLAETRQCKCGMFTVVMQSCERAGLGDKKNASNSGAQSNSKQKPPQKALNDLGVKRERERRIRTLCERKQAIKSEKRGN